MWVDTAYQLQFSSQQVSSGLLWVPSQQELLTQSSCSLQAPQHLLWLVFWVLLQEQCSAQSGLVCRHDRTDPQHTCRALRQRRLGCWACRHDGWWGDCSQCRQVRHHEVRREEKKRRQNKEKEKETGGSKSLENDKILQAKRIYAVEHQYSSAVCSSGCNVIGFCLFATCGS